MSITTPAIAQKLSELTSSQVEAFQSALDIGRYGKLYTSTKTASNHAVNFQTLLDGYTYLINNDDIIENGDTISDIDTTSFDVILLGCDSILSDWYAKVLISGTDAYVWPVTAGQNLKFVLEDMTTGYAEVIYGEAAQNKWSAGIWADTFATVAQQNAFYIYQYYDKAGASVNQTRFMIDNSGNVGIGTTSPQCALDVNNTIRSQGSSSPAAGAGLELAYASNVGYLTAYDRTGGSYKNLAIRGTLINWYIDGAIKMTLDNSGNVGIGKNSLNYKLEISDTVGSGGSFLINIENLASGSTTTPNYAGILFSGSSNYAKAAIIATDKQSSTFGSDLIFRVHSTTSGGAYTDLIERMRITSNGYIGIGTNAPGAPLDIRGNTNSTYVVSIEQDNSTGYGILIDTDATLVSHPALRIKNGTTELFYVGSNGNIGIGTTSPNRLLEVNGVIGAGNSTNGILMYLSGTIGTIVGRDMGNTAYNDIEIRTGASPNGIYIDTSGNIGIGTNSPGNRLHIYENTTNLGSTAGIKIEQANAAGDAALTFITLSSTFCMGIDNSVTGDPFRIVYGTDLGSNIFFEFNQTYQVISPRIRDATSASSANVYIDSSSGIMYRSTSSKKVKENINFEIDPCLIFKLKPCEYKSKLDKKNMIGFIAEQVNEIDKRFATGQDNKDGLLGLEINAILAAAVAGLQNINKRLIKLEKTKTK